MTIFVGVGALLFIVPPIIDVVADFAILDAAQPLSGAGIESGKCSVYVVLVRCEATLTASWPDRPLTRQKVDYLFFDSLHAGQRQAVVFADSAHANHLTTDLALNTFGNRVATMLLLGPVFLSVSVGGFAAGGMGVLKGYRISGEFSGQLLHLVSMRLVHWSPDRWTVSPFPSDLIGETRVWEVRRGYPILIDPAQGLILGVAAVNGTAAMPLDDALSFVDLKAHERQALLAWIGPQTFSWPPGTKQC